MSTVNPPNLQARPLFPRRIGAQSVLPFITVSSIRDVDLTGLSDNAILVYDGVTEKFNVSYTVSNGPLGSSSSKVPTEASVKAYVDENAGGGVSAVTVVVDDSQTHESATGTITFVSTPNLVWSLNPTTGALSLGIGTTFTVGDLVAEGETILDGVISSTSGTVTVDDNLQVTYGLTAASLTCPIDGGTF